MSLSFKDKLPITVLIAAKNEAPNLPKCFDSLKPVEKVFVIDSCSSDSTVEIAISYGVEVVQFHYKGGYPKKRQWALDNLDIKTPWVFLIDADEVVPNSLWDEIKTIVSNKDNADAYMIKKGFHFLGKKMKFGPNYIIPTPFDTRLISRIPVAVAKAAVKSGVAKKPITQWDEYAKSLQARRDPTANSMSMIFDRLNEDPKRVVFAEGEQDEIIKVAAKWRDNNYGTPILIGKDKVISKKMAEFGIKKDGIEVHNAAISAENNKYSDYIYKKLQREGVLYSDCERMVKTDRNIFASAMLSLGHADCLVTGLTRGYRKNLNDISKVVKNKEGEVELGISILISKNRTVFVADTACSELSSSERLAQIAIQTSKKVEDMGYKPRVAFLSYSNFGSALHTESKRIKDAVVILDKKHVNFEYDGEMTADVALNKEKRAKYPFCRLTDEANILICPGLHSANIATKLLEEFSECSVIGPILTGFEKSVQIVTMRSSVDEILNMTALAAINPTSK